MSKDNGFACDHPTLRSGDTFDQLRRIEPCLYCERDALAARLAAVEAECTDLIAGKEYQAMQRTLAEVNARLAEVTRERDEAVRELRALRGVIIDAMVSGKQPADSAPAVACNHFHGQTVCEWCKGTGAIDAPTSADDPSCPECDGEGTWAK